MLKTLISHFRVYNLSSGKIEVDSKFPTHIGAFLGLNPGANIAFQSTGESEFVSILMDGNQSVYPLVKDSTPSADSIKDPQLLDLPPIQALGIGKKNLTIVFAFQRCLFMYNFLVNKDLSC